MRRVVLVVVCLALIVPLVIPAAAQDELTPERVELEAADGLLLIGDYFAPAEAGDSGAPAVLLLHMLNSNRGAWTQLNPLVPQLVEAGYAVLAVDMRGHGETGGDRDWALAESDVQAWIDWLRDQPGVDPARVNLVGGSIGANLALRGMANDGDIVTTVALSPGLNYQGVTTEDALATIRRGPVLLVAALGDAQSGMAVKTLITGARGPSMLRLYHGGSHGTSLLMSEPDMVPLIVFWLNVHNFAA